MTDALLWPALLGVLGLVFGSFIATVGVRWPEGRSALIGRSACDGCGGTLRAIELVPLLSWAVLRGRCRACGARIGLLHPLVEALGCAIGIAAGLASPGADAAAGAAFGWLLLLLGVIDAIAFRLPNPLVGALALGGVVSGAIVLAPPLDQRLIGGIAGFLALEAVRRGYRALRGREGLGGGDPMVFGAIGLWLGWRAPPPTLLIACVAGLAVVLVAQMRARPLIRTDQLPLGTLLAAAAFAMWLHAAI